MCKEGGGGQREERHRHAQVTDGQVDDEELGRLQHGPLPIGHEQEQRVPREGHDACRESRGMVQYVTARKAARIILRCWEDIYRGWKGLRASLFRVG